MSKIIGQYLDIRKTISNLFYESDSKEYGLDDFKEMMINDIQEEYGISKEALENAVSDLEITFPSLSDSEIESYAKIIYEKCKEN